MSNSYFQFKQFKICQDKCAMKVCTDACIFGAYISCKEKDFSNDETNILDIGAGTGLLSLMIAQKVKGNIEAVEIENKAFEQAGENFKNSLWPTRLSVLDADITEVRLNKKYNIIVSNPPFFTDFLKSNNKQKDLAKNSASLPHNALVSVVCEHLSEEGKFYILLPKTEFNHFTQITAKSNLSLVAKLNIRQTSHFEYFRTIGVFSKIVKQTTVTEETLTIKNENDLYTKDFIELLQDYYLYL